MRYLLIFLIVMLLTIGIFAQDSMEILMDKDKSVTAHFKKIQYALTTSVEPIGSGTISGAGTYDVGTSVTVEAIPVPGYVFDHWSGDVPGKWSGLTGFTTYYSQIDDYADTWLANGFTEGRDLRDWADTNEVAASKVAVISATAKGIKCIWGVCSGSTTITSTNWADFRAAILSAAQWAQDNGVYEFQIGNEEEYHIDGTTMTVAQLIINLKDVATDAQAIFTNGNISYSFAEEWTPNWITAGKGDIDLIGFNVYMEWGENNPVDWEGRINALIGAFGTDGMYITEFAPNSSGIEYYSEDETVQAAGVTEMIDYFIASGIERALFYNWKDGPSWIFGVVKDDGTYRLLWNSLLNSE